MKITIHSRDSMEKLLKKGFTKDTAVISFYDPPSTRNRKNKFFRQPVDYSGKTDRVFQVALNDIDIEILDNYGLTYEKYFTEADELAEFIYAARNDGFDLICQCEYGQSRSAGCAAAIREHFYQTGISVFTDYKYYPNQVIYHKVFNALEAYKQANK